MRTKQECFPFFEEKSFNPNQNYRNEFEKNILDEWIQFRKQEEEKVFGEYSELIKKYIDKSINLGKKEINNEIITI